MKMLRPILLYGSLVASLGLLYHSATQAPCNRVIHYDIGVFDERFRLDEGMFKEIITNAEKPWEEAANRELFIYTPGADFKVNLRWSEEQDRLYKGHDISTDLDTKEKGIGSLQFRYESAVTRYERSLREYESKLKKYERDVDYWNNKGGAPSETYNKLQQESGSLKRKMQEVNQLRSSVNTLADKNNTEVQKYNQGVQEYNKLFKDPKEFDAGNTDGREINVYSYDGKVELTTLLIHEFGHVLGIEHVESEDSVMYYLLSKKNGTGSLSTEDITALNESCPLK